MNISNIIGHNVLIICIYEQNVLLNISLKFCSLTKLLQKFAGLKFWLKNILSLRSWDLIFGQNLSLYTLNIKVISEVIGQTWWYHLCKIFLNSTLSKILRQIFMNFIYINNKVLAIALLNLNLNDTISLWWPLKVANVGRNLSSTSSILAIYFITNYYFSLIQIYFTVF